MNRKVMMLNVEDLEQVEFVISERVLDLKISLKGAIIPDYIKYLNEKIKRYEQLLEKVREM